MAPGRFDAGVAVVNDTLYVIGGFPTKFSIDSLTQNPSITYHAVTEQNTPTGHIPEFPSLIILPLFLVATLVIVVARRKVFRPT